MGNVGKAIARGTLAAFSGGLSEATPALAQVVKGEPVTGGQATIEALSQGKVLKGALLSGGAGLAGGLITKTASAASAGLSPDSSISPLTPLTAKVNAFEADQRKQVDLNEAQRRRRAAAQSVLSQAVGGEMGFRERPGLRSVLGAA